MTSLSDIATQAIQHALGSIEDARGPLIPFTLLLDATNPDPGESKLMLTRHAVESLEQALGEAQASVVPNPAHSMYAIAWDGFITVDGRKWDAVLVEAGEATAPEATVFAQRYELKEAGFFAKKRRHVAVGAPIAAGAMPSRLHAG